MIRSSFPRAIIENRRPFFFFSFQVQGGKKKNFFKESRTQSLQEGDGKMYFFFFSSVF